MLLKPGPSQILVFDWIVGSSHVTLREKEGDTMGDKGVETFGNKIDFRASWTHFSPFPPNNVDFSISWTAWTTVPTQH